MRRFRIGCAVLMMGCVAGCDESPTESTNGGNSGASTGGSSTTSGQVGGMGTVGGAGGAEGGGDATGSGGAGGEAPSCAETCDAHATCQDVDGDLTCVCDAGWLGSGTECADVDECDEGTDDCDANATCGNEAGAYTCTCNDYYAGPGNTCSPADPTTLVRDISDRPVEITTPAGAYLVHGLSRIAWEIEVIESAVSPTYVEKFPGAIGVPDITMTGIEGSSQALALLSGWATSPSPMNISIVLDGLSTEQIDVSLSGVMPVSADTTIVGDQMAELVLSVTTMEVTSYNPPAMTIAPKPGKGIEIEGTYFGGAATGDLSHPAAGTTGSYWIRELPHSMAVGSHAGDLIDWMEFTMSQIVSTGDVVDRRAGSLFDVDAMAIEVPNSRINYFESFPFLLYLFNPARRYGSSPLVDVHVTYETSQQN